MVILSYRCAQLPLRQHKHWETFFWVAFPHLWHYICFIFVHTFLFIYFMISYRPLWEFVPGYGSNIWSQDNKNERISYRKESNWHDYSYFNEISWFFSTLNIPSDKRLHDFEKRNMLSLCNIASVEKIHFSLNHVMGQKEGRTWKSYKTKVAWVKHWWELTGTPESCADLQACRMHEYLEELLFLYLISKGHPALTHHFKLTITLEVMLYYQ